MKKLVTMDCSVVPDVEMDASEDSDCSGEAPLDNFKTIQTFFTETAKISSQIPYSETNFESLSIFSTLRPYQRETVHWMIDKECNHKNVQSKNFLIKFLVFVLNFIGF